MEEDSTFEGFKQQIKRAQHVKKHWKKRENYFKGVYKDRLSVIRAWEIERFLRKWIPRAKKSYLSMKRQSGTDNTEFACLVNRGMYRLDCQQKLIDRHVCHKKAEHYYDRCLIRKASLTFWPKNKEQKIEPNEKPDTSS